MLGKEIAKRFLFLDALRGIAALYVAIFHFYSILKDKTGFSFPSIVDVFLLEGTLGVQIFFVLSGFVIAYSIYQHEITLKYLGKFFIRRSVRLDPPYWITVLLTLLTAFISIFFFTKPLDDFPTFHELVVNLFYLQDFFQMERIVHVSWTLCLEIQLYVFFVSAVGIVMWLEKPFNKEREIFNSPFFFLSFGSLFVISIFQNSEFALLPNISGFFAPYWYNFFIGSVLCWAHLKAIRKRYFWMACALLTLAAWFQSNKQMTEVVIISLVIYGVNLAGKMRTFLDIQPLQYLGKISYSLYLTHWLFAGKLMDSLARRYQDQIETGVATFLLTTCLLLALITAHFFYRWIEAPSLQWSRQLKYILSADKSTRILN